jgi:hypothetical protein
MKIRWQLVCFLLLPACVVAQAVYKIQADFEGQVRTQSE